MTITIQTTIQAPLEKVWTSWTTPTHITHWNFATDEWHCPEAVNDLKPGGTFSWRMEAKDGSMGFDYAGTYLQVKQPNSIEKQLADGRKVDIFFTEKNGETTVTEVFEPDLQHDPELQRQGWQAILQNFKNYVESQS